MSHALSPASIALPRFAALEVVGSSEARPAHPVEEECLPEGAVDSRLTTFRMGRAAVRRAFDRLGLEWRPVLSAEDRRPVWPEGVAGSIAHTESTAVALVAPNDRTDGVGVDIETPRRAPEIDPFVLASGEIQWVDDLDDSDREAQVLRIFSAKECIYKAFYPRVRSFFGFDAATLTPASGGFEARLTAGLDPDYPPDRRFLVRSTELGGDVLSWLVLPKT